MTLLRLIFFLSWLGMFASPVRADVSQKTSTTNENSFRSGDYINDRARYFIDHDVLGPDEVIRRRETLFPAEEGVPRFIPETSKPVWVLLELEHEASTDQLFFVFTTPWPDRIDFYLLNEKAEIVEHQVAGDRAPFDERVVYYRLPAFKPALTQGRNFLLFRIHTTGPVLPEIRVWPSKEFFQLMVQEHYLIAACLGSLLVIGIYNFFLYLSIRDKNYLYYTLYIASLFFTMGFIQGAFIYYDPTRNTTTWSTNAGIYVAINLSCITSSVFCRKFLNMADYMRWMERAIIFWVLFAAFSIVGVSFLNYRLFTRLTLLNSAVTTSSLLFASFKAATRGYKPAFFFIPAWTLFLSSTLVISLSVSGFIDFTAVQSNFQLIGASIEGVILSFALGYRIKLIKEKEDYERSKKDHYFSQMEKVFHPHQLVMMQNGNPLEETMPTRTSVACVIAFDIANSSRIGHSTHHHFFESVLKKCQSLMNRNYVADELRANAFRIKEVGDGFLCSVGFPFKTPHDEPLELFSYKLALQFVEIFKSEVRLYFEKDDQYCGIGIAMGEVVGYFPASGTKEYDLFGDGIIHATRYENMRKMILSHREQADIVILQESVYKGLTEREQANFEEIDLKQAGLVVRDDHTATRLYYQILNSQASRSEAVPA